MHRLHCTSLTYYRKECAVISSYKARLSCASAVCEEWSTSCCSARPPHSGSLIHPTLTSMSSASFMSRRSVIPRLVAARRPTIVPLAHSKGLHRAVTVLTARHIISLNARALMSSSSRGGITAPADIPTVSELYASSTLDSPVDISSYQHNEALNKRVSIWRGQLITNW